MRRSVLASTVCLLASLSTATAATLESVSGRVLTNAGRGFAVAPSATPLRTGAQVFATRDASALIVYDNGCFDVVEAGQVITVRDGTDCLLTQAQLAGGSGGPGAGGSIGGTATAAAASAAAGGLPAATPSGAVAATAATGGGVSTGVIVGGVAVVAGVTGGAVLLSRSGKGSPASP